MARKRRVKRKPNRGRNAMLRGVKELIKLERNVTTHLESDMAAIGVLETRKLVVAGPTPADTKMTQRGLDVLTGFAFFVKTLQSPEDAGAVYETNAFIETYGLALETMGIIEVGR